VTSSNATAGGVSTGAGFPPTAIDGVIGVSKAYITRVGAGPFPSEDHGEKGERIRNAGGEFGTVTGRPRRCGWFDVPLLKYTSDINGFDSLAITKLDVLDELDKVKVCAAYKLDGKEIDTMPATREGMAAIEPVYETLPGWKTSTTGIRSWADLPENARKYLDFLAERTGIEVGSVSVGPERTQTVLVKGSKLEGLLGGFDS